MKRLRFLFYAILAICLFACGGNKQAENNSAVSTDKVEQADAETSEITSADDDEDDIGLSEQSDSEMSSDDDNNADLAEIDDSEESTSLSSSSEELAKLLEAYKSNVSRYVSLAKKTSKGDLKTLAELPKLLKETKKLRSQLSEAESELSADQLEQFNEISKTLLEMASESE